ncbi:MAG: hypothetical protein ACLQG3_01930 [Terracidiphilus sp.]
MSFFDEDKSKEARDRERAFGRGVREGRSGEVGPIELGLREVIGTAVPSAEEYDSWMAGVRQGISERGGGGSKTEKHDNPSSRGGGGGGGGAGGGEGFAGILLIILAPLLLVLGMIALSICPAFWLVWRIFRKKPAKDPDAPTKFVGGGWVLLAIFMLIFGLGAAGDAIRAFMVALSSSYASGFREGELIIFGITASWAGSLALGAIDILRKNRVGVILGVLGALACLGALGYFVSLKNIRNARPGPPSATAPVEPANQAPTISVVNYVLPQGEQTITITGSGFGTKAPYEGDSKFIRITDQTKQWNAGSSRDYPADKITLSIASWTDTQIEIRGFAGAYGSSVYSLSTGDHLAIQVWNPQTGLGPAVNNPIVVEPESVEFPAGVDVPH